MNMSSAKANFGSIRGEVRDAKVGRKTDFYSVSPRGCSSIDAENR